ncbi:hypothetical protein NL676_002829 [Syzygium grande]|nr:hypothetical protein NL676_002829 [Syzygium grande]
MDHLPLADLREVSATTGSDSRIGLESVVSIITISFHNSGTWAGYFEADRTTTEPLALVKRRSLAYVDSSDAEQFEPEPPPGFLEGRYRGATGRGAAVSIWARSPPPRDRVATLTAAHGGRPRLASRPPPSHPGELAGQALGSLGTGEALPSPQTGL